MLTKKGEEANGTRKRKAQRVPMCCPAQGIGNEPGVLYRFIMPKTCYIL